MAFLSLKKREIQTPKDPDHLARRTIRQGLDIIVDLDRQKAFLDGLGGQHELENITYDGSFIACKLPGKNFFTHTASINISQWTASLSPETYGDTPENLLKRIDELYIQMKKESYFQMYLRKNELSQVRASILGDSFQEIPATHEKFVEQLNREYSTARQSVLWLVEAAKALQEKRYSR